MPVINEDGKVFVRCPNCLAIGWDTSCELCHGSLEYEDKEQTKALRNRMRDIKPPTKKSIHRDVQWTKEYIGYIKAAHDRGDFREAAKWANEISAIWGTIMGEYDAAADVLEEVAFNG